MFIFFGSDKSSVQNSMPPNILTPVIRFNLLKFNTPLTSTSIGAIIFVTWSYSTIASVLESIALKNQYIFSFCGSLTTPIQTGLVRPNGPGVRSQNTSGPVLLKFCKVLPSMFSTAPTSEPSDVLT